MPAPFIISAATAARIGRQDLIMSDSRARRQGFPVPRHGILVRDAAGRLWTWRASSGGVDDLGLWSQIIGIGGGVGAGAAKGLIGGPVGAAVGAGIGLVTSLITSIFGAHAAKVKREDEISGAWAASGPAAITAVMDAYKSGKISGTDAIAGLQQIEAQFVQMTAPIAKYNGKFGAFPDPNGPRPPNNCNWACGTAWDLHQQIKGLTAQIQAGGAGGVFASLGIGGGAPGSLGDPVVLIGLGVLAFMFLK